MRVRVASAGTGKTTSLVTRYLELIGTGTPLRRIAGVTFTRAAAAELRARVGAGLEEVLARGDYLGGLYEPPGGSEPFETALREVGGAQLKTIHGFMIAGLRLSAPLLGYDPRFAMVTEPEALADFEEELDSLRLLARDPDHPLHAAVLVAGEDAVALPPLLFKSRSLAADLVFGDEALSRAVGALYKAAYARLLARYSGRRLGPGEVERAALLMLDHPVARDRLVGRYPMVLVDEYQDVNPLQGEFFERLEAAGASLELVGDPKQSIYLFRNADVNVFRRALARAASEGTVLPPLTQSRRHARAVVSLLNRLTTYLGANDLGFSLAEAPEVSGAGSQAEVPGSVEVVVVTGEARMDELRPIEADALAERLVTLHGTGVPYERMAVLARNRRQLARVEATLAARGVPALFGRRGLYTRQEVLDVRYALEVGAGGGRESLAPFLRGPLAGLALPELREVLSAPDPLAALSLVDERVHRVVRELKALVLEPPVDALKAVLRRRLGGGAPLVDRLSGEARANVDALLFEVGKREPEDLARLFDLLSELERSEAEDVPGVGGGVRLLTVHGSKGLEFDVVAVYDAGYSPRHTPPAATVDPATGRASLLGAEPDPATAQAWSDRSAQEDHRLLYVAVSRARDHLIVTGSHGARGPAGWLGTLLELGLENGEHGLGPDVRVSRVSPGGRRQVPPAPPPAAPPALEEAEWTDDVYEPHPFGPLSSPSRLVDLLASREDEGDEDEEPLTRNEATGVGDALEPSSAEPDDEPLPGVHLFLPGRGRVVGTLVHFAISQDWAPDDTARIEGLRAQEVMFPFTREEQDDLLAEVTELLAGYRALLGTSIPDLRDRDDDRAELPLAYPGGPTVWEGVIDRLYRVGDDWWIDDYKTDRHVRPERYHVQLGLYRHAVSRALGVAPRARLVYLRSGRVVELDHEVMQDALLASGVLGVG